MKKITCYIVLALILLISGSFIAAPKENSIHWLTVDEAQKAYQNNPKPILIDIYTTWCYWCKVMEDKTYSTDSVANYINAHYYAVKFDAESKDSVQWEGKTYGYNAQYKFNEFASYLANTQLNFPTTVFIAFANAQPAPLPGYLKPGEFEGPLKYFGEGAYKTQSFIDYMKTFSPKWK